MAETAETLPPDGAIAVIFIALRTAEDEAGYAQAAARMAALAAEQPGSLGLDSARGADQRGITVSYWADEASAIAWRDQAEHSMIREIGRARWYAHYRLMVTQVLRSYAWQNPN